MASKHRTRAKKCAVCRSSSGKMKLCAGCKDVQYCSVECQKTDWKAEHKNVCRGTTKTGSSEAARGNKPAPEVAGTKKGSDFRLHLYQFGSNFLLLRERTNTKKTSSTNSELESQSKTKGSAKASLSPSVANGKKNMESARDPNAKTNARGVNERRRSQTDDSHIGFNWTKKTRAVLAKMEEEENNKTRDGRNA